MKAMAKSGTRSLHSTLNRNKEVTTVIAAVNTDGGKSLIYMVEILLAVMLMNILINVLQLLLDMCHKPFFNS